MASALFVSDIRDSVCDFLTPTSAAALAQTSQYFFRSSVRQLWGRNVVPLERLLVLLPDVQLDEWFGLKVDPSVPFSSTYFDRFNLYAPHVKQLLSDFTWDPSSAPLQYLDHWSSAALPRLISLTISQNGTGQKTNELLQLLISSSLLTVSLSSASWDRGSVRKFVGLVRTCPDLKSLSVVGSGSGVEVEEQDESSFELVVPRNLETLELSASELRPQFLKWIGRMPNLRELRLTDTFELPLDSEAFELGSFAALKELSVAPCSVESAIRLWETPMVSALTSATVTLRPSPADPFWGLRMGEFMSAIGTRSPNLKRLSMVVLDPRDAVFSADWLSSLDKLSLDSLAIRGIKVVGANVFGEVARIWPTLSSLDVCDTTAGSDELVQVATLLPKLSELSVRLSRNIDPPMRPIPVPKRSANQDFTLRSTFGCVIGQPAEKWDSFAKLLSSQWPNIKCVHACKIKERSRILTPLNAKIMDYSKLN